MAIPTLNELKEAWGLSDAQATMLEKKLERLVASGTLPDGTSLVPDVGSIVSEIRKQLQPGNIEFAILRSATEIASALKTVKIVIVKRKGSSFS